MPIRYNRNTTDIKPKKKSTISKMSRPFISPNNNSEKLFTQSKGNLFYILHQFVDFFECVLIFSEFFYDLESTVFKRLFQAITLKLLALKPVQFLSVIYNLITKISKIRNVSFISKFSLFFSKRPKKIEKYHMDREKSMNFFHMKQ